MKLTHFALVLVFICSISTDLTSQRALRRIEQVGRKSSWHISVGLGYGKPRQSLNTAYVSAQDTIASSTLFPTPRDSTLSPFGSNEVFYREPQLRVQRRALQSKFSAPVRVQIQHQTRAGLFIGMGAAYHHFQYHSGLEPGDSPLESIAVEEW
ncbi:MAG: hypothetical protein AAFN81_35170, partial [Bacteroidota bacterium]